MYLHLKKTHLISYCPEGFTGWEFVFLLLKDLALGCLGESEVHHFIHKFIHRNKVVTNTLLLKLLKVLLKHLHQQNDTLKCDLELLQLLFHFFVW